MPSHTHRESGRTVCGSGRTPRDRTTQSVPEPKKWPVCHTKIGKIKFGSGRTAMPLGFCHSQILFVQFLCGKVVLFGFWVPKLECKNQPKK